ncbi:MAG: ferritin-like domain-containing protein [Myxococcales bacterium]|nr:ferritin-like domain-containing protein [Myxococcales bacterium]
MDLGRMLDKCVRDQWSIDDLDWSIPPPAMTRDKEEMIVQAFLDMAGIERLAGALFEVQREKTEDPTLKKIFSTFVADEKRHAAVAARLAEHYNVHEYRTYTESEALTQFRPHFLALVRNTSPEIANAYITSGELILDVALLRSLDDYVADDMSHAAMHLINRDESRHIAIDFHMTEHYCSDEHLAEVRKRPRPTLRQALRMTRELATMMWYAKPFLQQVFLAPMDRTDPSGKRIHEAFKRIQLVLRKPTVARTPFSRFMIKAQELYNHPVIGKVLGPVLLRALGAEDRAARILFTQEELARTQRMSFDELAEEAIAVKYGTN